MVNIYKVLIVGICSFVTTILLGSFFIILTSTNTFDFLLVNRLYHYLIGFISSIGFIFNLFIFIYSFITIWNEKIKS